MKENHIHIIKTGSDPSQFPEFELIKLEIHKLSHPRQPQIDWKLIENNALILFEKNGIDLLTISYYTLARYQYYGFIGFVEGCELLAALVYYEWNELWPTQELTRIEALDWFNSRIGNLIRKLTFTENDIELLQRADLALGKIADKIQQVSLKRLPKIVNLYYVIQNNLETLENKQLKNQQQIQKQLSEKTLIYIPEHADDNKITPKNHEIATETGEIQKISVKACLNHSDKKQFSWRSFGYGVILAIVVNVGITKISNNQLEQKLAVTGPNLSWFSKKQFTLPEISLIDNKETRIQLYENYKMQLLEIASLSPISFYYYADNLVQNMQKLWPDTHEQKQLANDWQKLLKEKKFYLRKKVNYYNALNQIRNLKSDVDNAISTNQYITLDYLHIALDKLQKELESQQPIEEILRQIEKYQQTKTKIPDKLKQNFNQQLQSIMLRYYLIDK